MGKLNFIQKIAFNVIKNEMPNEIQRFLTGADVEESEASSEGCITATRAMKYSAVFGCVRVLGETLASMPIMLYKKDLNGERKSVNDLRIYDVLHHQPNDEMSPFNFKECMMNSLNLGGNAVCEKLRNIAGDVIGLYPYRWENVKIKRDEQTKKLIYIIKDGIQEKTLQRDDVFHIPGLSFDGVTGISPIEYATSAIRLGISHDKFGNSFYKNGANPSGAFSFPAGLSDTAYQRLKSDLNRAYSGMKNTGKPMLLEEGGKFEPFSIKPIDAQLIESKKFQIEDVCRIYRVPLHLVQNLDKATNNNIEHLSLEFIMYTMLPWVKRWEENINMQLLTVEQRKSGYFFEFKIDGLLRGDAKSRADAYAVGRQWGWLSVNDIRKLENLNPIENGDIYLEPMNMTEAGKKDGVGYQQSKANTKALADEIFKMISERRKVE